jgi:simple sugar transport system permease protein
MAQSGGEKEETGNALETATSAGSRAQPASDYDPNDTMRGRAAARQTLAARLSDLVGLNQDRDQRTWRGNLFDWFVKRRELGPLIGLLVAIVGFNSQTPYFFSQTSLTAITTLAAPVCVVSIAVSFLLISGEFDLSVGTMYGFTPIVWIILFKYNGIDPAVALAIAILISLGFGLLNGIAVVVFRVPSFIATLGTFFLLEGLDNLLIGGGDLVVTNNVPLMSAMGERLGTTPFYAPILYALVLIAITWFIFTRTTYGNWSAAAGVSGGVVAKSMGVPVARVKLTNFMVTAALAGFAGCLESSYLRSVTQNQGTDLALLAITAIIVGGTSIYGGSGSIIGAAIGALLVSVVEVGLILVGAPGTFYISFIGGMLVVVVIFNARLTRLQRLSRT